ncbi:MAG: hypothetical protein K2L12_04770, partial [Clostridia bacterium]|nr:hypothetical protein [Clostridia bacterium]
MKKKLFIALLAIISVFCLTFALTGSSCNGTSDSGNNGHTTHVYDQKSTNVEYLKSEADCTHKAVYYKSCECGEKGTETFEYGTVNG